MSTLNTYTVTGHIKCRFQHYREYGTPTLPDPAYIDQDIPNLEVQLWHKTPLHIEKLGNGYTNTEGEYTITFSHEAESIKDVFIRVYYQGQLIAGDIEQGGGLTGLSETLNMIR